VKKNKLFLVAGLLILSLFLIYLLQGSRAYDAPNLQKAHVAEAIESKVMECMQYEGLSREKGECLEDLAPVLVADYGFPETAGVLGGIEDLGFRLACHEFMHYLGWATFIQAESLADAFIQGSSICDSGVYHGIMEAYVDSQGLLHDIEGSLRHIAESACNEVLGDSRITVGHRQLCYHGLGHGFMLFTDYDLPTALKYCDFIPDNMAGACYSGVFMENSFTSSIPEWSSHGSEYIGSPEDPTYPCRILEPRYLDSCYRYQSALFQFWHDWDYVEGFRECLNIPDEFVDTCLLGVGNNVPGAHIDNKGVAEICAKSLEINSYVYQKCIEGAIQQIAQLHTGRVELIADFCTYVLDGQTAHCYRELGKSLRGWVSLEEGIEKKCSYFQDKELESLCLNPAEDLP